MTDMESKLRNAGVNVDHSRLASETYDVLRRVGGNEQRAAHIVMQACLKDVRLLNELLGRKLQHIVQEYVAARAADMKGSAGRGSHTSNESQRIADPTPAPSSEGASRGGRDSQRQPDRPSTSLPDASHTVDDRQRNSDRSGTFQGSGASREQGESQGSYDGPATRPPAAVNPALKAAARAVLRTAADYQIPGTPGRRLGSITKRDFLNLSINTTFHVTLQNALAKRSIPWPDMNTPLEKIVPLSVLRDVEKEIQDAADKAIRTARSLSDGSK